MVLKKCAVCGREFNALGKVVTCSEKCRKINKSRYAYVYYMENNSKYYAKNWLKWREYEKSRKKVRNGTGELSGKMHKDRKGDPDFDSEARIIKKELIRIGIVYPK